MTDQGAHMNKFSPNHGPADVRVVLRRVIDLMQYFFDVATNDGKTVGPRECYDPENIRAELNFLLAFHDHAALRKQILAPYTSSVVFRFPTVWCCREHDPMTWLFMLVCIRAKIHPKNCLNAFLRESDFRRLNKVSHKLRRPKLSLLNAREPEDFWLFLEAVDQNGGPSVVYCDWQLASEELKTVEAITKHQEILFVWPVAPPAKMSLLIYQIVL